MGVFSSNTTERITLSDTTAYFSGVTHLSFYSGSWVGVSIDHNSNNTGEISIGLFTATETVAQGESWDTTPTLLYSMISTSDLNKTSFPVQGPYRWRVGVVSSSASTGDAIIDYRTEAG